MEIRILTVGKIKEKYLNDGIAEYAKRLSRYCKLTFCQVPDEKTPDKASDALNEQIKATEAERLMKHIRDNDYVIALGDRWQNAGFCTAVTEDRTAWSRGKEFDRVCDRRFFGAWR